MGKAKALARAVKQLGEPVEFFMPSPMRMCLGLLLGLGICTFGMSIAVHFGLGFADTSRATNPWLERWGTAAFGLLIASGGVWLLWWTWGTIHYRVLVCPEGLIRLRRRAVDPFPWDSIKVIHQTIHHHKVLHGPSFLVPHSCSHIFHVVRHDGECIRFDRDKLKDADRLGALLKAEARCRRLPWQVEEASS